LTAIRIISPLTKKYSSMKDPMQSKLDTMEVYKHINRAEQSVEHLKKSLNSMAHFARMSQDIEVRLQIRRQIHRLEITAHEIEQVKEYYKPF
jgi:hypothetical protein